MGFYFLDPFCALRKALPFLGKVKSRFGSDPQTQKDSDNEVFFFFWKEKKWKIEKSGIRVRVNKPKTYLTSN